MHPAHSHSSNCRMIEDHYVVMPQNDPSQRNMRVWQPCSAELHGSCRHLVSSLAADAGQETGRYHLTHVESQAALTTTTHAQDMLILTNTTAMLSLDGHTTTVNTTTTLLHIWLKTLLDLSH